MSTNDITVAIGNRNKNGRVFTALLRDSIDMSIRTDTGIHIPNEKLNRANKSTLISIIDQLTNELSDVKGQLSDTRQDVADLRGDVAEMREDVDRSSKEVADVRGDVEETREDVDRVWKEVADTNGRVSDLEENEDTDVSQSSEGQSSPDEGQGQGSDGQSTALEQVVGLPDDVAMNSLSANQKRARSIAKRINEYGKSVPAGIAITSSRMRDILSGLEDKRVHRQTVQRVMDFLKRFGDGHIDTKETRGGKTVVVFSESVVERVTSVVTADENTTVTPTLI